MLAFACLFIKDGPNGNIIVIFIIFAQIEAIMNDYIQLKPQSNIYEAETMVEG